MAFAIVAHTVAGSPNGANVTTSAINTTGADLIVIAVATFGGLIDPSDNKSNTYTALTGQGGGGGYGVQLFYLHAPTVGSGHTFSVSASSFQAICVIALSGSAASPFDQESGSAGSVQPGSITPAEDNEILITCLTTSDAGAQTIDGGFTTDGTYQAGSTGNNVGLAVAYLIQTTATAKNPSWDPANGPRVAMATFKAGAGGGGGGSSAPQGLVHFQSVRRASVY